MSAQLIDGKAIAAGLREQVKKQAITRIQSGKAAPGLAVILIGEDPASQVYVRKKQNACKEVGFHSEVIRLPDGTSQKRLFRLIDELNERPDIHGILLQLPLPAHIHSREVIERIRPDKDVDGFHPCNVGQLALSAPQLRPCTPKGVMVMLEHTGVDLTGRDVVVVGQSNIVGRPMLLELLGAHCSVTVCHRETRHLPDKLQLADILIVAIGVPEFIQANWIKPGAIVIDVGINRRQNGSLCGDVDFSAAREVASWITPVPGGVGPMTVATLLQNTLQAAEMQEAC